MMRIPLLLPFAVLLPLIWNACADTTAQPARGDIEARVSQLTTDPGEFEAKHVKVTGRVQDVTADDTFLLRDEQANQTILVVLPTTRKVMPQAGDIVVVNGVVRKLKVDNADELRREFKLKLEDAVVVQHADAPLLVVKDIKLRLEGGDLEVELEDLDEHNVDVAKVVDDRGQFIGQRVQVVGQVVEVVEPRVARLRDLNVDRALLVILPANVTVQPGQIIVVFANVRDVEQQDIDEVEREVRIRIEPQLLQQQRVLLVANDVRVRVRIEERDDRRREDRRDDRREDRRDDRRDGGMQGLTPTPVLPDGRGDDDRGGDGGGGGNGGGGDGGGGDGGGSGRH